MTGQTPELATLEWGVNDLIRAPFLRVREPCPNAISDMADSGSHSEAPEAPETVIGVIAIRYFTEAQVVDVQARAVFLWVP